MYLYMQIFSVFIYMPDVAYMYVYTIYIYFCMYEEHWMNYLASSAILNLVLKLLFFIN